MKLTKAQIEQLYTFTQKHFVEWYDVQTELVDHLANGIEAQWQDHPMRAFDDALSIEFKKFGIMGFSHVVEEKTKALNKRYWHLIWSYYKAFFTLPKIILTLFLIWLYYQFLVFSMSYNVNWWLIPTLTIIFGLPWYFMIKEARRIVRLKKLTGKKWLFDNVISQLGGLVHLMNIAIYLQIIFQNNKEWPMLLSIIFSICTVSLAILLYVAVCSVAPKLKQEVLKQHPEYKII